MTALIILSSANLYGFTVYSGIGFHIYYHHIHYIITLIAPFALNLLTAKVGVCQNRATDRANADRCVSQTQRI